MWKLVIEDDEGKRTVVPLTRDDYGIGRQEGNTIRLTERNVSRNHGRVRRAPGKGGSANGALVLEDLRSYNGIFVNGVRVGHTQDLQHGDLIQIGDYRLVVQDDATSSIETAIIAQPQGQAGQPGFDPKVTMPLGGPAYRAQSLMDRPNRLVMLVGPTPGVEFTLDRERLSVGRADDATISVNHNSVSRLHCEIQALGDGRFEIVDKASANGVRVNGVELRRSIIEAGDLIELGDVRFKFIGAGQVFVAGPNESQQLAAISDRDAELALTKRRGGLGGFAVPILGAGLVGAALIVGAVVMIRQRVATNAATTVAADPAVESARAALLEAQRSCAITAPPSADCAGARAAAHAAVPPAAPLRTSREFIELERVWGDHVLRRAAVEQDASKRRALLEELARTETADASQRQRAEELLAAGSTTPETLPLASSAVAAAAAPTPVVASVRTSAPPATASTPRETTRPAQPRTTATGAHPQPTSHTTVTNATAPATATTSSLDRAREAALNNQPGVVRNLLEARVMSGQGSPEEARLVRQACKQMADTACSEAIKLKYPSP